MHKLTPQNVFYVDVIDWTGRAVELKEIRKAVFIDEQHVPVELEWDGIDENCTHFIVRSKGSAVATARLTPEGQIGRMAVLADYRNRGIGTTLLLKVLSYAKESGFDKVYLHAQTQVTGFYEKHDFLPEGDIFMDAGIPHIEMHKHIG